MTFRRYITLAAIEIAALILVIIFTTPKARADLGNAGPGGSVAPGLCEYPAVCGSGMDGALVGIFYFWEDWPVESNGSHRHCQWGGAATTGNLGFSMMVQVGATGPVGALNGMCQYVCPSGEQAHFPNPPGAWRDAIIPTRCQPIGPNPWAPPPPPEDVPIAPPIAAQGAVPAIPFGQPQPPPGEPYVPAGPPPAPFGPDQSGVGPSVTNPACPNPMATTDSSCH
jgi:hypothetical protein